MLLNFINATHYNTLAALIAPQTSTMLEYNNFVKVLEDHLYLKKNILIAQHWFFSTYQNKNQSLAKYKAFLRPALIYTQIRLIHLANLAILLHEFPPFLSQIFPPNHPITSPFVFPSSQTILLPGPSRCRRMAIPYRTPRRFPRISLQPTHLPNFFLTAPSLFLLLSPNLQSLGHMNYPKKNFILNFPPSSFTTLKKNNLPPYPLPACNSSKKSPIYLPLPGAISSPVPIKHLNPHWCFSSYPLTPTRRLLYHWINWF